MASVSNPYYTDTKREIYRPDIKLYMPWLVLFLQSKLPLRAGDGPQALSLIHNDLQTELDSDDGHSEPPEEVGGSQAANPKGKKSTTCNGGKLPPQYKEKCDQTTSGAKEFKVYTADGNTWSCRLKHEGLCYYCYKAPTCPVCGKTKRRIAPP